MRKAKIPRCKRQVIVNGGGLSGQLEAGKRFYAYVIGQAQKRGKQKTRVLVINTATGDKPKLLALQHKMLEGLPVEVKELHFFERTPRNLKELILSQDVILVGGGNTKSMLAVWREYGLPKLLKSAWKRGIVLAGSSAGAICWFESALTDSWDEDFVVLDCLGILPGSATPHYNGNEGQRKEICHSRVVKGELASGIAIDETVAVHFKGTEVFKVVSHLPNRTAYKIKKKGGEVRAKALPVEAI